MKIGSILKLLTLTLLLSSCLPSGYRTVNLTINAQNSGWYFVEIIKTTKMRDTGEVNLKFNDSVRMLSVRVNDINKAIINPYDEKGNSISSRLKFFGVKYPNGKRSFLTFYNPSDAQLVSIDKWNPTNQQAMQIMSEGDKEFDGYVKDSK